MKVKDGFVMRDVAGQTMVVATGAASESFHGMVKLNETGKFIWQLLAEAHSEQEIASALAEAYDVSPEQAAQDVAAFIAHMREAGFLTE